MPTQDPKNPGVQPPTTPSTPDPQLVAATHTLLLAAQRRHKLVVRRIASFDDAVRIMSQVRAHDANPEQVETLARQFRQIGLWLEGKGPQTVYACKVCKKPAPGVRYTRDCANSEPGVCTVLCDISPYLTEEPTPSIDVIFTPGADDKTLVPAPWECPSCKLQAHTTHSFMESVLDGGADEWRCDSCGAQCTVEVDQVDYTVHVEKPGDIAKCAECARIRDRQQPSHMVCPVCKWELKSGTSNKIRTCLDNRFCSFERVRDPFPPGVKIAKCYAHRENSRHKQQPQSWDATQLAPDELVANPFQPDWLVHGTPRPTIMAVFAKFGLDKVLEDGAKMLGLTIETDPDPADIPEGIDYLGNPCGPFSPRKTAYIRGVPVTTGIPRPQGLEESIVETSLYKCPDKDHCQGQNCPWCREGYMRFTGRLVLEEMTRDLVPSKWSQASKDWWRCTRCFTTYSPSDAAKGEALFACRPNGVTVVGQCSLERVGSKVSTHIPDKVAEHISAGGCGAAFCPDNKPGVWVMCNQRWIVPHTGHTGEYDGHSYTWVDGANGSVSAKVTITKPTEDEVRAQGGTPIDLDAEIARVEAELASTTKENK